MLRTFLINIALFMLVGCRPLLTPVTQVGTSTPQPFYSPIATPSFFHYTSTSTSHSDIYLEFDCPSSWGVGENLRDGQIFMTLYDPRYFTLPTPFPGDDHPPLNDFGFVSIRILPVSPSESFEQFVEKYTSVNIYYTVMINNYAGEIDGQESLVFEYRIDKNNPEIYSSEMFSRDIFFTANNLIYKIKFTLAEKDRGNEFEKGYEYFIKSLRIAP